MRSTFGINKIVLMLFFLLLSSRESIATHIVGGDVSYVCLGGDRYRITFSIYRDCIGGLQGAIDNDDPALITVFTPNGIEYQRNQIRAQVSNGEIIPPNFKNDCVNNPPKTCLNKITFVQEYYLPGGPSGYKILYQNCCRNRSVININNPGNTGATYSCTIPPASTASCNNSAIFRNFPPQIICINNPLVYDHSAYDADGDSLSYQFCTAYDSPEKEKKDYPLFYYDNVSYRSPFTSNNPMAGNPKIQIDPKTGLITGTPNMQGRFVVSVCCNEWRNGKIINTVTREFQFVVTNCSKAVIADIPQYSSDFNTYIINCADYTVFFENNSIGGTTYHWDFGVPGRSDDTSNAFTPTFIYPDSGTYVVSLVVNPGTTCTDSISRFVKVYPKLRPNFGTKFHICPGETIQFTDSSTSTYPITNWIWNFDDHSTVDSSQNPSHTFQYGGLYNVGLIAINSQGCLDTIFKKVLVDPFKPNVGNDTTIVVGEKIYFNGQNNGIYTWMPEKYLSNAHIFNPVGSFVDTGKFSYLVKVVSETGCIGYDTINVRVLGNPYLAVPNAFTPNGDGKNDIFRPLLVGYQSLKNFKIFNRYGQEIFSTQNLGEGWDGTFNGQEQEVGVYYWILTVRDRFGNDVFEKGDVSLLR